MPSVQLYIKRLDAHTHKEKDGTWEAHVDLEVRTVDGAKPGPVLVTGTWSGAHTATVTLTTKEDGRVRFASGIINGESVTLAVTSVSGPGAGYAPHLNVASSASLSDPNAG
jgi:hypothetical protein